VRRRRIVIGTAAVLALLPSVCLVTRQATGEHAAWRRPITTPEALGLRAERVTLRSADSTPIRGYWIAAGSASAGVAVLAHGQGANGSYMLGRAAFLVGAGFDVLVLDLRDCGESGGWYVTPGYKEADDVLAGVAYARRRDAGKRVVLLGHSAGAVAVLRAGASGDVDAVIAESPFASYRDMMGRAAAYVRKDPSASRGAKFGMWASQLPGMMAFAEWVFRAQTGVSISPDRADALVAVRHLGAHPVLFVSGGRDVIAPPTEVARLARAAPGPLNELAVIPAGAHDVFDTARAEYERVVLAFLNQTEARRTRIEPVGAAASTVRDP
jgi:pimeloyl-ACP methyl ester carboxylesterase